MLLDRDSKKCNIVWEMLEKIVLSAVMISEDNQDAVDHFVSASTEKIRRALAEAVNDPAPDVANTASAASPVSHTETKSQAPPPPINSDMSTAQDLSPNSAPPVAPPPPPGCVPVAPPPPPGPPGSVPPPPPPLGNIGAATADNALG